MNTQPQMTGLPEHGLELAGSPETPFVINHHPTKAIIGYVLVRIDDTGTNVDISRSKGQNIAPGGDDSHLKRSGIKAIHRDGSPVTIQSVTIDSVIFADGEFVGPDKYHLADLTRRAAQMGGQN